jgi:PAB1-binding protein PBP1
VQVNEKKFGVKSSYTDDNSALFTVALDKNSKDYKEKLVKADRLAAEIESVCSFVIELRRRCGRSV